MGADDRGRLGGFEQAVERVRGGHRRFLQRTQSMWTREDCNRHPASHGDRVGYHHLLPRKSILALFLQTVDFPADARSI